MAMRRQFDTTQRCSLHGINYPPHQAKCAVIDCEEELSYIQGKPDEDWLERAEAHNAKVVLNDQEAQVYTWRFLSLWEAGYDSVVAEALASTDCDLHLLVDAKTRGCSDELALSIFL